MLLIGFAEGIDPALQALSSFIVGKALNANFFALVSMLDAIAELLGGPLMAHTYSIRGADGHLAGFCFLLSAVRTADV